MIVWDIETGPQPDTELLRLYDPPEEPGKFYPDTVDIGRATKPETITKKIDEARRAHAAMLADWDGHCERHRQEWLAATREKAALDPVTGQVLAIGLLHAKNPSRFVGEEEIILTGFWALYQQALDTSETLVGHNILGFDLPFLVRRSWLLDVSVPDSVIEVRGSRVYFDQLTFRDTMQIWAMDGRSYVKLDTLVRAFGIEGKLKGCTGADFHRLFHGTKEERATALAYLDQDVRITRELAIRMGLI